MQGVLFGKRVLPTSRQILINVVLQALSLLQLSVLEPGLYTLLSAALECRLDNNSARIGIYLQTIGCSEGATSQKVSVSIMDVRTCHCKARCPVYPGDGNVSRFAVPDENVAWNIVFPEYLPVEYTAPSVLKCPAWADSDYFTVGGHLGESAWSPKWNSLDGMVNRQSHIGHYFIDQLNRPLNPMGRTGVCGRGLLGRWGPNHAADPIVTRWKRDNTGKVIGMESGQPIAQFISIQRRANNEWAIPGGMVDVGEVVSITIRREFGEEALNSLAASDDERKQIEDGVSELFAQGVEIYRGYVDDPRNTDNAWMETVAVNFHDDSGDSVGKFNLTAGDDAIGVQWMDLDRNLQLYASHKDFLHRTALRLRSHW